MSFVENLPQGRVPREQASYGAPIDDLEWLLINHRADRLTANTASKTLSLNAAEDERKTAIEKITGKSYDEAVAPYRLTPDAPIAGRAGMAGKVDASADAPQNMAQAVIREREREAAAADALVADLQVKGQGTGLLRNSELAARARELALDAAVTRDDATMLNDGDFSAAVAGFAGTAGNSMADPVFAGLLPMNFVMPELGLLKTMAAEGGLGGLGSAISLPGIAAWQKEIGLPEMTGKDMAKQVALDAALSAGTAGLLKVGGRALSRLVTPRQAVDAFDRAFPDRDTAPPDLVARRDTLEVVADLADDNPLGDTPAQEAEHLRRVAEVNAAVQQDKPCPATRKMTRPWKPHHSPKPKIRHRLTIFPLLR